MRKLINKLKSRGYKISVAESCTGGLVSKLLTDVPGASQVFDCAVTTYSNQAKMNLLGVKAETLEQFGAISVETAKEMASGVLALANSDIGISVTGLAGPSGDEGKPVGTVCIGVATAEKCYGRTFLFSGTRAEIRRQSAKMACNIALEELGISDKEKITKKAAKAAKETISKLKNGKK